MHNHCVCMYMYMYKNIFWVLRLRDQPFCFIVRLICECAGGVCGGGVTRFTACIHENKWHPPFIFPAVKISPIVSPISWKCGTDLAVTWKFWHQYFVINSQKYFAMFHALWMCYASNFLFWKNFSRCFDCNDEGKLKFWGENGETNLHIFRNLT